MPSALPPSELGTYAEGHAANTVGTPNSATIASEPDGTTEKEVDQSSDRLLDVRVTDTPANVFGMFRRVYGPEFPVRDPERLVDLAMLTNTTLPNANATVTPASTNATPTNDIHHPYPNENSFLLGDWFWNYGGQKSHENFKRLIDIVGREGFLSEDIRSTNWAQINAQLGANQWDEGEWVDEDAGWHRSTVIFQVPFHRHTHLPGTRDFVVSNFHHRSLVAVIKEKLTSPHGIKHFHFEPYELKCILSPSTTQPGSKPTECRLYGELYTSPTFIEAYKDLQQAPGEPGCSLPRVVIALMFWSDATHLTNFGSAKLWPLYLFFGNESKYRRCKPSLNLCEHIAYFENVRHSS